MGELITRQTVFERYQILTNLLALDGLADVRDGYEESRPDISREGENRAFRASGIRFLMYNQWFRGHTHRFFNDV